MLVYYFNLALRSFKRNRALTALMILALGLGIGASMTALTVFYTLSGDPLPGRSDTLFYPQMDPRDLGGETPGNEPAEQLTRLDAEALLRARRADRQAMMTSGNVVIRPTLSGASPFYADARYTSSDFFVMFDAPFLFGGGWGSSDDDAHAHVVVISKELNDQLFDGQDSVGKTVFLSEKAFQVIGVLRKWRPVPRFYDMTSERYGESEQAFIPFSTAMDLKLERKGSMSCWGNFKGENTAPSAPCAWLQFWVQIDPQKATQFQDYLVNYSDEQRAAGRFLRPTNVRLHSLTAWLDYNKVVPTDVRLQVWLAYGFLVVCLINTVGLLLAKILRRSREFGIRRALGASKRAIFVQVLVEAGSVGLAGGSLGLLLAWLGLWAVRQQPAQYAKLAYLDPVMLLTTFAMAVFASLLAGLLPAWRACQVAPSIQLKAL